MTPTLRRRLIPVAAGAGTVIGLLAIVISLAVSAGTSTSSTDTVSVQQGANGSGQAPGPPGSLDVVQPGLQSEALTASVGVAENSGMPLFSIPVDAPWDELWAMTGPTDQCVLPEQIAWIEQHGVPVPPQELFAQIFNAATSGSDVTIRDIRPQGVLTAPLVDTVLVEYAVCTGGGEEGVYAHITLGVDPVAIFDGCYAEYEGCYVPASGGPIAGDPIVFSVRPGETRSLHLSYSQTADFVGRFVATVEADGETATIDLSPGTADIVSPAVTRPQLFLRMTADPATVSCADQRDNPGERTSGCTLEQWLQYLAAS